MSYHQRPDGVKPLAITSRINVLLPLTGHGSCNWGRPRVLNVLGASSSDLESLPARLPSLEARPARTPSVAGVGLMLECGIDKDELPCNGANDNQKKRRIFVGELVDRCERK
jgi:hypothetical protein